MGSLLFRLMFDVEITFGKKAITNLFYDDLLFVTETNMRVHSLRHRAAERLFFHLIGHFKCCFEEYEMRHTGSKGSIVAH